MLRRFLQLVALCTTTHASTLHLAITPMAGDGLLLLDSQRYTTTVGETFSISRCSSSCSLNVLATSATKIV